MQTITVTIDKKTGKAKIHVEGAEGPACLDLTKRIEEQLGKIETQEPTADYHRQPVEMQEYRQ
jgi:hypothetical protein